MTTVRGRWRSTGRAALCASAALAALSSACGAPRARLYPLSETDFALEPPPKPPRVDWSTPPGASPAQKFDVVSARFAQLLQQSHTPGGAVALILNGKLAFARGLGVRSVQSSAPVSEATLFRVASASKPLLALAALRLVEQGKLTLDEGVDQRVPYFTRADARADSSVTLRRLLTHTAGIPDYALAPCSSPDETIRHFFSARGRDPLTSPAGWFRNYSNHGYALAAGVISEVTGRPFERAVNELVFSPLGMRATYDGALVATLDHAVGHDGANHPLPFPMPDCEASHAAGGIYASVVDLARMLEMLLERGGSFLRAPTIELMERAEPDLAEIAQRRREGRPSTPTLDYGYGLGFQIMSHRGVKIVAHGGVSAGYSAYFAVAPELGVAAVALANSQQAPVELWPLALQPFVQAPLEPEPEASARQAQPNWDKYVGSYNDPFGWLGHVRIVKEAELYYLDLEGGQPFPIPAQLKGQLRESPDGAPTS